MTFAHSMSPRISPVEDPDPEVSEMLDKTMATSEGVPLSIFRTMARHPRMMKRFNVLGGFFLTRGELPARDRELVILHTAYRTSCEYEWAQHVILGRNVGLHDDEIAKVALGGEWDDHDSALFQFADEVLDHSDVSDPTWAAVSDHYSELQLIELVTLVGFYQMTASFLNATGVVQENQLPGWPEGTSHA